MAQWEHLKLKVSVSRKASSSYSLPLACGLRRQRIILHKGCQPGLRSGAQAHTGAPCWLKLRLWVAWACWEIASEASAGCSAASEMSCSTPAQRESPQKSPPPPPSDHGVEISPGRPPDLRAVRRLHLQTSRYCKRMQSASCDRRCQDPGFKLFRLGFGQCALSHLVYIAWLASSSRIKGPFI